MLNIQEVYEKYFTVVYRYLLSLSHNTHIAEELTQETFFKALKKVDDFRGECDLHHQDSTVLINITSQSTPRQTE